MNLSPLVKEFIEKGRSESCSIINMHAHLGPFQGIYFPNPWPEDMIRTMDRCGITIAVSSSHAALIDTRENYKMAEVVAKFPDRFRAYWVINPNYPERIPKEIAHLTDMKGFVGFKFFPDYHKYPITSSRYEPAMNYADENALLILMHTWGKSSYSGPSLVEKLAGKYSDATILMAHSGFGEWEKSIQVARENQNVYLELTSAYRVNGVIDWMVRDAGSNKIVFGNDLPWFDPYYGIGCVLFSRITDEDRYNILRLNAVRLLRL